VPLVSLVSASIHAGDIRVGSGKRSGRECEPVGLPGVAVFHHGTRDRPLAT
jgi:hypothetical protein